MATLDFYADCAWWVMTRAAVAWMVAVMAGLCCGVSPRMVWAASSAPIKYLLGRSSRDQG